MDSQRQNLKNLKIKKKKKKKHNYQKKSMLPPSAICFLNFFFFLKFLKKIFFKSWKVDRKTAPGRIYNQLHESLGSQGAKKQSREGQTGKAPPQSLWPHKGGFFS